MRECDRVAGEPTDFVDNQCFKLSLVIHRANGVVDTVAVLCRVDTLDEVSYYRHGGILQYVLRGMAKAA